jgi:two-component system chemotaxis response regulator CheY
MTAAQVTSPPTSSSPATAHTILVVDDAAFCRELVTAALKARNYEVLGAGDGRAALDLLAKKSVDLAILDYEMPRMTGMELLKAMRADPKLQRIPVVMLTDTTNKEIVLQAGRLRVTSYMLKSKFSLPDLLARVERIIQAGPLEPPVAHPPPPVAAAPHPTAAHPAPAVDSGPVVPHLLTRDVVVKAVLEITKAKSLPGAVADIIQVTTKTDASVAEVSSILKQDPVLASRVLHLASSAAYATGKPRLMTIEDAVRNLGSKMVHELATTAGIFEIFREGKADGLKLLHCWQHAVGTAVIMSRIVPRSDVTPPGLPYLIGLCHDLAEILMRQQFPAEYAAASDFAQQCGKPLSSLFASVFGVGLDEIAAELLQNLKLPPAMFEPIADFWRHQGKPAATECALARSLAIANSFAHGLQLCSSRQELVGPTSQNDCRLACISPVALNGAEIRSEVIMTTSMLAKIAADKEKEAMEPLLPSRMTRIWYVRHNSLAVLDPLEAALKMLCQCQTHDRAPKGNEATEVNAIIVAAATTEAAVPLLAEARETAGERVPVIVLLGDHDHGITHGQSGHGKFTQRGYPLTLAQVAEMTAGPF